MRSNLILPAVALTIVALTTSAPAFAKSHPHAPAVNLNAARSVNSFNSINDPWNVIFNGAVVGRDPDPNVRMRIWLDMNNPA